MSGIDVAKRFPRSSLRQAWERSKQQERWVFDRVVCSSLTLLYGKSNVGKSFLVSSLLLSLMKPDREFMGMQPTDPTKVWKPVILWTDPGSDEEYGERWFDYIPEIRETVDIPVYQLGRTATAAEWEALTDELIAEGFNFVVLDNLMGVTGDTNNTEVCTTVFDGLTRLTNRNIPVVVLHHESEHGYSAPGATPMGSSVIVQKSRVWIQVRQTARRQLRGGNTQLIIQGNSLRQPMEIVADPEHGPCYTVKQKLRPWVVDRQKDDEPNAVVKPKQQRSKETLDRNAEVADWIVTNCQGVGLNKAAEKVAAEFDGKASSWRQNISQGALSKLLVRTGGDTSTVWKRAGQRVVAVHAGTTT